MRFSRRRGCAPPPTISYATVHNSLRFLKEAGLVHEIKFGDSARVVTIGGLIDTIMPSVTDAESWSISLTSPGKPNSCRQLHGNL